MSGRRFADLLLFCVTSTELVILFFLTPTFTITDWIYVLQHLIVLGIDLTWPHPMYLSYVLADIGYNLQEWNSVTLLLVLVGWASLVYRIQAEERVLSQHPEWSAYVAFVRYRLFPCLWSKCGSFTRRVSRRHIEGFQSMDR